MTTKTVKTKAVRIYMSGSIETAKQVLREQVFGLRDRPDVPGGCLTIEPTTFIYDGAEESGFVVGLINYPRFPTDAGKLWKRASEIARALLERTRQHSVLIMSDKRTEWLTIR